MNKEREMLRSIMISINKIDFLYETILRKAGLKANTILVLYALDDGKPHSQKQIYEEWLIPKTTLNTIVKELEREQYVRLEAIAGKRREMNLCLTEKGRTYARHMLDTVYQAEEKAFRQLDKADVLYKELDRFYQKLYEAFDTIEI